jgi:hypothetical protein
LIWTIYRSTQSVFLSIDAIQKANSDHGPIVQPVGLRWNESRYLISFSENAVYQPLPGQEVVLLVDEGVYYFDLRAIYIQGQVNSIETPPDTPAGCTWFEVVPIKTVAFTLSI